MLSSEVPLDGVTKPFYYIPISTYLFRVIIRVTAACALLDRARSTPDTWHGTRILRRSTVKEFCNTTMRIDCNGQR